MKNRLTHLNDHLFQQLERLNDESLEGDKLDAEIRRAMAMAGVADQVVKANMLQIRAAELASEYGSDPAPYLRAIEHKADA